MENIIASLILTLCSCLNRFYRMKFFIFSVIFAVATASAGTSKTLRAAIGSDEGWLIEFMRTKTESTNVFMLYRGTKAVDYVTGSKCGDCEGLAKYMRKALLRVKHAVLYSSERVVAAEILFAGTIVLGNLEITQTEMTDADKASREQVAMRLFKRALTEPLPLDDMTTTASPVETTTANVYLDSDVLVDFGMDSDSDIENPPFLLRVETGRSAPDSLHDFLQRVEEAWGSEHAVQFYILREALLENASEYSQELSAPSDDLLHQIEYWIECSEAGLNKVLAALTSTPQNQAEEEIVNETHVENSAVAYDFYIPDYSDYFGDRRNRVVFLRRS